MILSRQDEANSLSVSTAILTKMTYNMNRGENSTPVEDHAVFLPYPDRYLAKKQMQSVQGIDPQAAREYVAYFHVLKDKVKINLSSLDKGLRLLAKT